MIRPCFCVGYKADIMRGVHHEDDRYMLALYPAGADLTPYTKEYSPSGEISGPGYRPGPQWADSWRCPDTGTPSPGAVKICPTLYLQQLCVLLLTRDADVVYSP